MLCSVIRLATKVWLKLVLTSCYVEEEIEAAREEEKFLTAHLLLTGRGTHEILWKNMHCIRSRHSYVVFEKVSAVVVYLRCTNFHLTEKPSAHTSSNFLFWIHGTPPAWNIFIHLLQLQKFPWWCSCEFTHWRFFRTHLISKQK